MAVLACMASTVLRLSQPFLLVSFAIPRHLHASACISPSSHRPLHGAWHLFHLFTTVVSSMDAIGCAALVVVGAAGGKGEEVHCHVGTSRTTADGRHVGDELRQGAHERRRNACEWLCDVLTRVWQDLVAGTAAGVSQIVVGHPFDTIKVKMQSGGAASGGAMDALRHTVRTEGARAGLFRGMGAPLASVAAVNALLFTVRGQVETALAHEDGTPLNNWDQMKVGAVAGSAVSLISCPTELIKCRLQAQDQGHAAPVREKANLANGAFKGTVASRSFSASATAGAETVLYKGPIDVARRTGWKGLYRGYGATLLREVPGSALMLASYASALDSLESQGGILQKTAPLLAGALGGAVYWSITYPVDFIKSKVQTDMSYRNARECALKVFEAKGVPGFFRGFTPCFLRSLPANGATFVAYEVVRSQLN